MNIEIVRYGSMIHLDDALKEQVQEARVAHLSYAEGEKQIDYGNIDTRCVHYIASYKGKFAGCVQYDPEENRLRQMLVLPDFRRLGIGRMLVDRVALEAKESRNTELLAYGWASSLQFYSRSGFVPLGKPYKYNGVICQKYWRPLRLNIDSFRWNSLRRKILLKILLIYKKLFKK